MTAPDPGHAATDALLEKLIKKIRKEYRAANKDLKAKFTAYMLSFAEKDAKKLEQLANGQITQKEYNNWRIGQVMMGERWKEMQETIAEDLLHADQIAASITNGYTPEAYALNHNYGTYEAEAGALVDTSYTLYDRYTVERLFREEPELLPKYVDYDPQKSIFVEVNVPKTQKWNRQKINSAVLQGILQGESMQKIADRLEAVTSMDENAAIRNARTAVTGAENAGRVDSYKRAESMGIEMKQVWMATLDNRTRDSHAMLDGTKVDPGKRFPNGCRYPGDPAGPPGEVYNCRCTIVAEVEGSDAFAQTKSGRAHKLEKGVSYKDWQKAHDTPAYQLQKAKGAAWKSALDFKDFIPKTYSNIWRDDVTEADYSAKKGAIQAKRDYFENQLRRASFQADQQKWQDLLDSLDEFEKNGAEYERLKMQAAADTRAYLQMLRQKNPAVNDAFSQDRKDNAKWFKKSQYSKADAYYDPIAQKVHANRTNAEYRGYYEYTSASGGMNRPLAGFEAPRFSGSSGWDPKYYKGSGNVSLDNEGKGAEIRGLTSLINKSEYPDDVWLQTGQDYSFLEGFLGINYNTMARMSDADLQIYVGERREIPQFISTAVNRGGGSYNPGSVVVNIYCPAGSKMLYVRNDGCFGKAEHEMILQRGGQYEITRIYWGTDDSGRRKLFVDMDLHSELGYNLFEK